MQEANQRLLVAMPLAAVLIILLLYVASRSWLRVGIVLLAVPFSLVGALWLPYLLGYNLSLAVWVGIIALAGLDAETGMVMLLYLDNWFERFLREGRMRDTRRPLARRPRRGRQAHPAQDDDRAGGVHRPGAAPLGRRRRGRHDAPPGGPDDRRPGHQFIMELLIYPVIFYTAKRIALLRKF